MAVIPESELIINKNGTVYHLNLLPEHISDTIITVGDPDRVAMVSRYFDKIEIEVAKREFITHTGYYKGKRLTVISTGMGTDNIDILMNELDALVNIDFQSREPNEEKIKLKIVRVGTSGSLQESIPLGSHVASHYGVGLDSLMEFYPLEQTADEQSITKTLKEQLGVSFTPYCVPGSKMLIDKLALDMIPGNTLTCPGFYAPQGRVLRGGLRNQNLLQVYQDFKVCDFQLTNFEMETAGYYAMGRLLGHEMLSLNAIVANRITQEFAKNSEEVVDSLIRKTLDRI
ncbi:nucleoside phosphorylase [Pontibacter sp. BT310]|uniref:Uridine phosphorylase n=1 Tax=Pontibacter populi TaxID=890055 RepID=A0ABS6XCG3_9BACT|nr:MULTISPECIES: nucleoside phosphorylase [Pontibacter]MBJ6118692.1 nucleoside phosphorylase [Pontibacter sp. BT310]MBR0571121.1 nucleoside phosphorylase [Microvirga sp. STS03]MBW3365546.1 nucleoside phosphorylase [Pontibacter populi]